MRVSVLTNSVVVVVAITVSVAMKAGKSSGSTLVAIIVSKAMTVGKSSGSTLVAIIVSVAMAVGKSSGSTLGLAGWLGSGLGRKLKEPCRVPHVWPLSSVM